ncbi:MAG: hypothetical protein K1X47_06715 [Cyclobacteriaceae bacterium]|nr:hypothetical protein [Cyclobacteriaceae bacterium]
MTPERKRAIFYLSLTFVAGLLIGILIPGFLHHAGGRMGNRQYHREMRDGRPGPFGDRLMRAIELDSNSAPAIRDIVHRAEDRVHQLDVQCSEQLSLVLDSVGQELKPHLTAEQFEKYVEFARHPRGRGRPGRTPQ